MKCLAAMLAVLAVLAPANGGAGQAQYDVYGYGAASCGVWLENRPVGSALQWGQRGWVTGFVSGAGYAGQSLRATDSAGMFAFVDKYCTDNPLSTIAKAAAALVVELGQK